MSAIIRVHSDGDGGSTSPPLWSCTPPVVHPVRMHDAMACQQSGGFGRATTASQTATTARRKNDHGGGRASRSSSVLRHRQRCYLLPPYTCLTERTKRGTVKHV
jgi:hypothetical protein